MMLRPDLDVPAVGRFAAEPKEAAHAFVFPRAMRLTRPSEFRRVFDLGTRRADAFFVVLTVPSENANQGRSRLGLAISKKAAPKAVDRNRIKRLIRESFRLERHQWTESSIDLVVMARHRAAAATTGTLRASLARHWSGISQRLQRESLSKP